MASMDWNKQGGAGPAAYQDFLVPGMFTPFAERLVAGVGVTAGARVLDIACGTGIVTRIAAQAAGPGGAVTGVDLGEPMLEVARAQQSPDNAAPIEYLQGSADALPAPDDSFDVATCHHGLQFFPDRVAALRDARRALKPGGKIAVGCWSGADGGPVGFMAVGDALDKHVSEEAGAMIRSPFSISIDDLANLLTEAGFSDVQTSTPTQTVTFASHAEFAPRAIAAGPLASLFAAVDETRRDAVRAAVAEALAPYATDDGGLAFTMTSNVAIGTA
jgi:SAM-dependent methyltransferase